MIAGDEGKPMSILEYISDEPCDVEPYLVYLLEHYRGHLAHWEGLANDRDPDKPTARDCVITHLQGFMIQLENIQRKLERARQAVTTPPQETPPCSG